MFKNSRVKIWNWFAAGVMTLTTPEERKKKEEMSNYVIGNGIGSAGGLSYNPSTGNMGYSIGSQPATNTGINFNVTKANGGWIVRLDGSGQNQNESELYVIPDEANFDTELGKIITMNCLKAK